MGNGLLHGCAVGGVFQSPSAEQVLEVTKAAHQGQGVLYIYGNYTGDIINFDMAGEMAEMEGIVTKTVLGADDVASAPAGEEGKRRGVAGIFFVYKVAGAKANEGATLDEVYRVADKASSNVRTMGVALTPCIVPEVGKPSFTLGDDEMEIGMGIHGEPGVRRETRIGRQSCQGDADPIMDDLGLESSDEVSILMNGLGATCKEELYICFSKVAEMLRDRGIKQHSVYVGEYATSMEMMGFSISVFKLDEELKSLLVKPANTPFITLAGLKD